MIMAGTIITNDQDPARHAPEFLGCAEPYDCEALSATGRREYFPGRGRQSDSPGLIRLPLPPLKYLDDPSRFPSNWNKWLAWFKLSKLS